MANQQLKDSQYHLSRQDVKKVINAAPHFRDRCILKAFAQTAMRRFELVNLDVRDIDFERRLIYLGRQRTIPASEDLLGDLEYLLGNRKKGPVFTNSKVEKLAVRQINDIVARAGE